MINREKVMTWLEICGKNNDCSSCCPYSENGFGEYGQCRESLMTDAYDLLKEQEEIITGKCIICPNCGHKIGTKASREEVKFANEFMSDAVHETAKQFRRQKVGEVDD